MATVGLSLILWTTILVPLMYCVYKFIQLYLNFRQWKGMIMKLPGVAPRSFLLGHLGDLIQGVDEKGIATIRRFLHEYPLLYYLWFGPIIAVVSVHSPETVKIILKTSEPKPVTFGGYAFANHWLGPGLLLAGGHKWARNRKLLTPAFHFDILKPYTKVNNQCTELLLDKLSKCVADGTSFEAFTHISLLTLDVILRCAFSYESDCQKIGDNHPYVKAVEELATAMLERGLRPWLHPDFLFFLSPMGRKFKRNCDYVHSVADDIIEKRKKTLVTEGEAAFTKGRYLDFLDILLTAKDEDKTGLSEIEIRNEVDTFLFEGHDTTAAGITWTLYSLAANPECQRKCQEEVDEVLQGRTSDAIEWEDLGKLKYMSMCIKEGLRLHGVVPVIQRQITRDIEFEGYTVPRGTIVDIPLHLIHHNPNVWKDSLEYRPERFEVETSDMRDNYAFIPFSAGPRNCIGQNFAMNEMKIAIGKILRRFNLTVDPSHKVGHRMAVVMKSENGIYLKVTSRQVP